MSDNEKNINDEQTDDYEAICYMCRRPESKAGKLISIPNGIKICQDCMQKTFDTLNSSGFPMDFGNGFPGGGPAFISFGPMNDMPFSKLKKKSTKPEVRMNWIDNGSVA